MIAIWPILSVGSFIISFCIVKNNIIKIENTICSIRALYFTSNMQFETVQIEYAL